MGVDDDRMSERARHHALRRRASRPGWRWPTCGSGLPMLDLLERKNLRAFLKLAEKAEPADLGDVLGSLDEETRLDVVEALPPNVSGPALVEMADEHQAEETLELLAERSPDAARDIVEELADDEAADLVGGLDPADQERLLASVEDREEIEELLRYDPETAGGLMTAAVVTVRASETAGDAIESLRRQAEEIEDFAQVYVVDDGDHLLGVLPIKALVTSPAGKAVQDLMEDTEIRVSADTDQEEVARLMGRYNVPSVPVVDGAGKLLGQVTFDDVIDVVESEQTEDLLQFGGTSAATPQSLAARSHICRRTSMPASCTARPEANVVREPPVTSLCPIESVSTTAGRIDS